MTPENGDGLFIRDDDEGLFSRNLDGQLVRVDAPQEADYQQEVTLQIDGRSITVPLAEPLADANGNVVLDTAGLTTPRFTTIYDAAQRLYVAGPGDEAKIPIPTLCHQPHMTPVAVCRLCVVQIYRADKDGGRKRERKLLPACQHPVKDGMEVFTMQAPGRDGDHVRQAVKTMTELLAADHLKPAPAPAPAEDLAPFNELGRVLERCGGDASRFQLDVFSTPAAETKPCDASSPVFLVDHSACILCDRCIRACAEVKGNDVIGRTGKGASAGIGFDLAVPMGESSCVQCGECMVSCPTTAITFKPIAQVKISQKRSGAELLPASTLATDELFTGVPPKFLLWQQGLAHRRRVQPGEFLCRQGEPGNTAWIIRSGRYRVTVHPPAHAAGSATASPLIHRERTKTDVILGEMSCLSVSPRSADVVVLEAGELWEIRRNVLDRLMRVPSQHERFTKLYRERALDVILRSSELFSELEVEEYRAVVMLLRDALKFVRARRGQEIIRQGDVADQLYLIRLGSVRISIERFDKVSRVATRGPGTILGEIGLLSLGPAERDQSVDDVDRWLASLLEAGKNDLTTAIPAGRRTATVTALDQMELATIDRAVFLEVVRRFPSLRRRLVELSLARLRGDREMNPFMHEYVEQELYEGRSLLVLDLDRCTRCDECTRGCIEQHGTASHGAPTTRMLRDGRRFGQFVVATACRSCKDPDCLAGCPVDAIHRGRHHQIVIEDHCIGCGLCAQNCPYGSIFMEPDEHRATAQLSSIAPLKASTCDLCDSAGDRDTPLPRCVYACPHDAAFRMSGEELLARVLQDAARH
jgi:Fe-S-cluster-containing hydrogenase component 2/CRP-like cAMP-binding protein